MSLDCFPINRSPCEASKIPHLSILFSNGFRGSAVHVRTVSFPRVDLLAHRLAGTLHLEHERNRVQSLRFLASLGMTDYEGLR